jgi:uncharacterized protein YjhX (UPF0386 family)
VDEARAVIARLDRVELLERSGAAAEDVLVEIERLLCEVEAWLEREGAPARVSDLLEACREQLERGRTDSARLRPA